MPYGPPQVMYGAPSYPMGPPGPAFGVPPGPSPYVVNPYPPGTSIVTIVTIEHDWFSTII